ncbi:MAG TPA: PDZ domain-containing protein, partial [Candidatus Krumholzibacteria bacterium]|nr:PDZ domain-containing protein [Candidatus Krumholzibacteria bacterium]
MHRPSATRISRRILLAIAPLLIALEIPGAVELWHRPDPGMSLRGTEIVSVREDGPADLAGVRPEDVLLALNGQKTPDYPAYQAASFGLRAGDEVELELRRQSESVKLEMTLGTRSPRRRFRDYLATSMGLLFVFLGFITFLRRDDALGRLFYAICNLFALLLLDLPTFPWVLVMGLEELLRNAAGLFLPAAFLRFFLIFPEGAGVSGRRRHRWLLAPPLVLALFHLYIHLVSVPPDSALVKQVSLATAILFAVYIVAAIVVFDRKIRRENHWVLWSKLRLALVGMILGILPITLATVARQLWPANPAPLEEASLLLLPFVPLSFSVALLRTGTIDIAYLARQSMIALTLALPLAALGALLFLGLGPQLAGISRGMIYLVAVVAIFALSFAAMPARRPVARIIDRIFYPGQLELRERAGELTAEL